MSDAGDQIRNLIHRYSEAVDQGRFEVLDELFAFASVRTAMGSGEPGAALADYPSLAWPRVASHSAKMSPAAS